MSEQCSSNCSKCGGDCPSKQDPSALLKPLNENSSVGKVIAVVSGKGGVGKSMVTSLMAVTMRRRGASTAILDADITGPSIPKAVGVHGMLGATDDGIIPAVSTTGVKMVSLNLLLENETDPVVWRGPVIAGTVKQFWTDVMWGDVDYMFVDMPPGTGDVPLTAYQSLPLDGILIVTSPQELVGMIVEKAVRMAQMMDVPVLGIIENMSYFRCPDCGGEHHVFGASHVDEIAARMGIGLTAKLPMDPALAAACDAGRVEMFDGSWLEPVADAIAAL